MLPTQSSLRTGRKPRNRPQNTSARHVTNQDNNKENVPDLQTEKLSVAANATATSSVPRESLKATGQENKTRLPIPRPPLSVAPDRKRRHYQQQDSEVKIQTTTVTTNYGGVNLLKLPNSRVALPERPSRPFRPKQSLVQSQAQAHMGRKPQLATRQPLSELINARRPAGSSKLEHTTTARPTSPILKSPTVQTNKTVEAATIQTTIITTRSPTTGQLQEMIDTTTRRTSVVQNELKEVPSHTPKSTLHTSTEPAHRLTAPLPSPGALRNRKAATVPNQPAAPPGRPEGPNDTDLVSWTCDPLRADARRATTTTEDMATHTRLERAVEVEGASDKRPGKRRRDIDESNELQRVLRIQEIEDPMLAGEYSESIFSYMRELEIMLAPAIGYLESRPREAWSVRRICVDIACRVCDSLNTIGETVFLAVNLLDRFLSSRTLHDNLHQPRVLIVTCVLIASKFEERNPFARVVDFLHILARLGLPPLDPSVFRAGERHLLQFFDYKLGWPGPLSFLRRCSRADNCDQAARLVAKYILEIILIDERFVLYRPSLQAAAALYIGRSMQGREDWPAILIEYSGYSFVEMEPAVLDMISFLSESYVTRTAPFHKYQTRRRSFVSLLVARWIERRSHIQIL
ncbi:G2/mitotic-specific cyclin [Linnemannia elongata]|nr:G2/mitotic-specific cyclin [Linnemannia elongata]